MKRQTTVTLIVLALVALACFTSRDVSSLNAQALGAGLSTHQIDEAIRLGRSQQRLKPYQLSGFLVGSKGFVLTPFLRVAFAARVASEEYKPFSASDVTEEMMAPLLHVVVPAYDNGKDAAAVRRFVDVRTVVIMPKGSKDADQAVRPAWTREDVSLLKNAFGLELETKGLIAAFPRELFRQGYEIVIVYAERLGDTRGGKQEFRGEFNDKDIAEWR